MARLLTALVAVALVLACAADALAAQRYTARRIGLFRQPVYVAAPRHDSRLFVVERQGRIKVVTGKGKILRRPFLDIHRDVFIQNPNHGGDQRGLLSIAFPPDYARSGRLYFVYTTRDDTVQLDEIRRSRTNPNRADPSTRRHVLNAGHGGPFHHGGQLQFGPDGMLYMSTGMDDHPELSQDLGDLHGKILRIDPRASGDRPYTIPPDNPFVMTPGARPEIYLYGLRNPWRFSFDRKTGDLTIGDVGEHTAEEIDYLPHGTGAGSNFGYDVFEGRNQMIPGPVPAHYVPPVIAHLHPNFCGAIGGYVVRDRSLRGLYGHYLYNDLCQPALRSAVLRPGRARGDRRIALRVPYAVSFGEDSRGRVYAVNYGGGVYRIAAVARRR